MPVTVNHITCNTQASICCIKALTPHPPSPQYADPILFADDVCMLWRAWQSRACLLWEGGHGREGAEGKAGLRSRAAVMVLLAEPPPLPSSYLVMTLLSADPNPPPGGACSSQPPADPHTLLTQCAAYWSPLPAALIELACWSADPLLLIWDPLACCPDPPAC